MAWLKGICTIHIVSGDMGHLVFGLDLLVPCKILIFSLSFLFHTISLPSKF